MGERVLVVGGGIAGMPAAMISLHSDSVTALREIGVYDRLRETCAQSFVRDMQTYGPDGSALPVNLAAVPPGYDESVPTGLFVQRPDLAEAFRDRAVAVGVRLLPIGLTVAAISDGPAGVRSVTFTDGTQGDYDLVVGADGIRSSVREALFGQAYQPAFAHELSVRWTFDSDGLDYAGGFHIGPRGSIMLTRPKRGVGYLNCTLPSAEPIVLSEADARAHLAAVLAAFTNPDIERLAERLTEESPVIPRAFETVWVDEPWHRENVVLIGDAAHATSAHLGYGGGMALEDGVILGAEVAAAPSVAAALDSFYRRRRDRVAHVVTTSLRMLELEAAGEWGSPESGGLYVEAIGRLRQPY